MDCLHGTVAGMHFGVTLLLFAPVMGWAGYDEGRAALRGGDVALAAREFDSGARSGDARAQYAMGMMSATGVGVGRSDEESAQWFAKAAAQGHPLAQYNIALMYQSGKGVPKDEKEAASRYRVAAQSGLPQAQSDLGFMYLLGLGVERDYPQALEWLHKAAEQGHLFAQSNLGSAYLAGGRTRYVGGVGGPITITPWASGTAYPPDDKEGARWLRAAAARGHVVAQYNLALLLEQGRGVERDPASAIRLYQQAAAADFLPAFMNLAALYDRGVGPLPTPDASLRLKMKSSRLGIHRAREIPVLLLQFGNGSLADETDVFVGGKPPERDEVLFRYRAGLLIDPELGLPKEGPSGLAGRR